MAAKALLRRSSTVSKLSQSLLRSLRNVDLRKSTLGGSDGLRVVTPTGVCPLCRKRKADDNVAIGRLEVWVCSQCSGIAYHGLTGLQMAWGLIGKGRK